MLRKKNVKNVHSFSNCLFQASQSLICFEFFCLLSLCTSLITDFLSKNWQYGKKTSAIFFSLIFQDFACFFRKFHWNQLCNKRFNHKKSFLNEFCCETVNILFCSILTDLLTLIGSEFCVKILKNSFLLWCSNDRSKIKTIPHFLSIDLLKFNLK